MKAPDKMSRPVATALPPDLYRKLQQLAAERQITLSAAMRELLVKSLASPDQ